MLQNDCDHLLTNYRIFIQNLDRFCDKIVARHGASLACRAGCSGCCRHLTLFPVEASELAAELAKLPPESLALTAERLDWPEDGPCPLLADDLCTAYRARPIICRTHGLPLLAETDGSTRIDFCPLNFAEATSFQGDEVINLDTVNSVLVTLNAQFSAAAPPQWRQQERFSIADIIRIVKNAKETI